MNFCEPSTQPEPKNITSILTSSRQEVSSPLKKKLRLGVSQLSVRLQLRSWSHNPWVRAPRRALCGQLGAWGLLPILCLPLSLPLPYSCSVSLCLKNKFKKNIKKIFTQNRGAWVAQLVKHPTLAQVMISQRTSSSPTLGSVLTAQSLEPASWFCVSLSLSLPLPCSYSALSLSQK